MASVWLDVTFFEGQIHQFLSVVWIFLYGNRLRIRLFVAGMVNETNGNRIGTRGFRIQRRSIDVYGRLFVIVIRDDAAVRRDTVFPGAAQCFR